MEKNNNKHGHGQTAMSHLRELYAGFNADDLLGRDPVRLDNEHISDQLKGKTVLITGAAGSIGSEIVRQIIKFEPAKVIMLDQAETPLYYLSLEMDQIAGAVKMHPVICDITFLAAVENVFKQYMPHVVYHAAAYKHVQMMEDNPVQSVLANILGTRTVADLCCKYGVGTFVMISTDKAVNPEGIMGATKLIAEKYVRALYHQKQSEGNCATRYITTRFGNVIGSNGSVVPVFINQIMRGGPVTVTHPEISRYFMTIQEACQLVLEAGAMGSGGETYLFDMGEAVKIMDLAYKMITKAGLEPHKDIEIRITGLRKGEKLTEELYVEKSQLLPTHNNNIMVVCENSEDFSGIQEVIGRIIACASVWDLKEMFLQINMLVPQIKPTLI